MANENEVRQGIQQAQLGQFGLGIIVCQTLGAGFLAGHFTGSYSWGVFAFVVTLIMTFIAANKEKTSQLFAALMAVITIIAVFILGMQDEELGLFVDIILALLAGGVIAGGNLAGLEHLRDIAPQETESKNTEEE